MADRTERLSDRKLVKQSIELEHAPEVVWQLFADVAGVGRWLGEGASIDLCPGGAIQGPDPVSGKSKRGTVDRVEHGRSIELTWWDTESPAGETSVVRFELETIETGTRLTVTESESPAVVSASVGTSGSASGLWAWRLAMLAVAATVTLQPVR